MKSTENKISSEMITGQEAGGFHAENFRRRSRCILVFVILLIAFAVITVVNINSGNVHISVGEIARAIFLHEGDE